MDENALRIEVATCCRLLEYLELFDFSGHASVKIPGTDYLLINSRKSVRSNLGPQDIIKVNCRDDVFAPDSPAPAEVYIHTLIYRRRPEIKAITHTHSPAVIGLSTTGKKFVPITCRAAIFAAGVPLYDHSRTIVDPATGQELAETLGERQAVIMRGHGAVVVADNLPALLFSALSLELNAQFQLTAYQAGVEPRPLSSEELEEGRHHYGPATFAKAWQYYADKAALKI